MAYKSDIYSPQAKSQLILERAWEHVNSIPYRATSRWLFYRLLQDGFYRGKDDYKLRFIPLMSRVRHNEWGPWLPDSLADDRRSSIGAAGGERDVAEWASAVAENGITCVLDHWYRQGTYAIVMFEADAMIRQFQYYTRGVVLWPCGGMPSIDYKYRIAKHIEERSGEYDLPAVVLYFGDYDSAGVTIPETSLADIRGWCDVDFEVVRCGLNEGDAERFGIPENFDKPGEYQWEALSDAAARELITSSVARFVDASVVREVAAEARKAEAAFVEYVSGFAEFWQDYKGE